MSFLFVLISGLLLRLGELNLYFLEGVRLKLHYTLYIKRSGNFLFSKSIILLVLNRFCYVNSDISGFALKRDVD